MAQNESSRWSKSGFEEKFLNCRAILYVSLNTTLLSTIFDVNDDHKPSDLNIRFIRRPIPGDGDMQSNAFCENNNRSILRAADEKHAWLRFVMGEKSREIILL